jgi:hypothetical protein
MRPATWPWVLTLAVASVAVSVPGLAAVASKVGVDHAAVGQVVAPLPAGFLVAALVAFAILLARRRTPALVAWAAPVLLTVLVGVLLAIRVGVPLTGYYPSKVLWTAAVLGLPAAGVVGSLGLRWVAGRDLPLRAALGAPLAGLLLVAGGGAMGGPAAAFDGAWSRVDSRTVLAAVTDQRSVGALVVWVPGDQWDSYFARLMLDFYRMPQQDQMTEQGDLDVTAECAAMLGSSERKLVTTADASQVAARYPCAGSLTLVRFDARSDGRP